MKSNIKVLTCFSRLIYKKEYRKRTMVEKNLDTLIYLWLCKQKNSNNRHFGTMVALKTFIDYHI